MSWYWALDEWDKQGKTEVLGENSVLLPLCTSQIPSEAAWESTGAFVVKDRRRNDWVDLKSSFGRLKSNWRLRYRLRPGFDRALTVSQKIVSKEIFFKATVRRNTAQMTLSLTDEDAVDLHCVGTVATTVRGKHIDPFSQL
jgi:hypothetical protein